MMPPIKMNENEIRKHHRTSSTLEIMVQELGPYMQTQQLNLFEAGLESGTRKTVTRILSLGSLVQPVENNSDCSPPFRWRRPSSWSITGRETYEARHFGLEIDPEKWIDGEPNEIPINRLDGRLPPKYLTDPRLEHLIFWVDNHIICLITGSQRISSLHKSKVIPILV